LKNKIIGLLLQIKGISSFFYLGLNLQTISWIDSPYGYGEVLQTGYVDTALLLKEYRVFER
jgi:hypothetical protein